MPVSLPISHSDRNRIVNAAKEEPWFSDAGITDECLTAMSWKGAFTHPGIGKPPVDLLFGLFDALEKSNISPAAFKLDVTPPHDLSALISTEDDRRLLSSVLHQASAPLLPSPAGLEQTPWPWTTLAQTARSSISVN